MLWSLEFLFLFGHIVTLLCSSATTRHYCPTFEVYDSPEATSPYLHGVGCEFVNVAITFFRETTTASSLTSSSVLSSLTTSTSDTETAESTTPGDTTTARQATSTGNTSTQATATTAQGDGGGGGLDMSNKIGLGVGIGVGVPALVVAILAWRFPRVRRPHS